MDVEFKKKVFSSPLYTSIFITCIILLIFTLNFDMFVNSGRSYKFMKTIFYSFMAITGVVFYYTSYLKNANVTVTVADEINVVEKANLTDDVKI